MTRMTVWNPWTEMNRVTREFDQLLKGNWWPVSDRTAEFPLINARQKDDTLVLTAELPGINPAEIELSIEKNTLTLAGKRAGESSQNAEGNDEHEENFIRRERWFKAFQRKIELPFEVDSEKCDAAYEKGVLTVTLHRAPQQQAKKLSIKAG